MPQQNVTEESSSTTEIIFSSATSSGTTGSVVGKTSQTSQTTVIIGVTAVGFAVVGMAIAGVVLYRRYKKVNGGGNEERGGVMPKSSFSSASWLKWASDN